MQKLAMMTYFTFISSNSFNWSVVPKVPVYFVFLCFGLLHGTVPSTLSSNTNIIFIPVPPKTSTGMLKAKTTPEKSCTHLCVSFCKGGKWLIELNSPEVLCTGSIALGQGRGQTFIRWESAGRGRHQQLLVSFHPWRFSRPEWLKPWVTMSDLTADPACNRVGRETPWGLFPPDLS